VISLLWGLLYPIYLSRLIRHNQSIHRGCAARPLLHASSSGKRGTIANTYLEAYTKNEAFILVAANMDHNGEEVGRYVLFKDKRRDDDDEPELVYYKGSIYWLNERVGLVQFTLELYNLFSVLGK